MTAREKDVRLVWANRVLTAFSLILFFATAWMCLIERCIFQPPPPGALPQNAFFLRLGKGSDSRIAALHLPARNGERTILYSHGNAEDLSSIVPLLESFRRRGFGVLAYDYEGYGASTGVPSEQAAYRDIERCWEHLTCECGIPPESILVCGRSVGSGPATWLAARKNPGGLILIAPFRSAFAVVGLGGLPGDPFSNERRIRDVRRPVLIVHGDADSVIPHSHAERLFQAAGEPKKLLTIHWAGHDDIFHAAGSRFWRELEHFDAVCGATQKGKPQ